MIGTLLYHASENFFKSAMRHGWEICIDLRASKGKEDFYHKPGFQIMTADENGNRMENMSER